MERVRTRGIRAGTRVVDTSHELGRAAAIALVLAALGSNAAHASSGLAAMFEPGGQLLTFIVFCGVVPVAILGLIHLRRERLAGADRMRGLDSELRALRAVRDRADALLRADDLCILDWRAGESRPTLTGSLARAGVPDDAADILAFGVWMTPATVAPFEQALESLREEGRTFTLPVETRSGTELEAQGRISGSLAFVRLVDVTGVRADREKLWREREAFSAENALLRGLLDEMDGPAWLRGADGRLAFVNRAYTHAVEGTSSDSVVRHRTHLLEAVDREAAEAHHAETRGDSPARSSTWRRRTAIIVAGERRMNDVTEVRTAQGTAGFGVDMNELEATRNGLEARIAAHQRTLDNLATAVATFDHDDSLVFYNRAFLDLWGVKEDELEDLDHGGLLELLRGKSLLAEQGGFRAWRDRMTAVHRGAETFEDRWALLDGRTVRAVATPESDRGTTWVYENVTEQNALKTALRELTRVRGETLNRLREAVAVFGTDGRLKLSNPAFDALFDLPPELLRPEAPLQAIADVMESAGDRPGLADDLRHAVSGNGEREAWGERLTIVPREAMAGDAPLSDGIERQVLDLSLVPLPDGQTLLAFADVTDTTRVRAALREREAAFAASETLKRNFMEHISENFRAPLTTILMAAELLRDGLYGALDAKQAERVGDIATAGTALDTLFTNAIALAEMTDESFRADMDEHDVTAILQRAATQVEAAAATAGVRLEVELDEGVGTAFCDAARLCMAVSELLANAVRFSPEGGRVRLTAKGDADGIDVTVTDEGPGVPEERRATIFERFEAGVEGGAGLGLAIAKTVIDLHGGHIEVGAAQTKRIQVEAPSLDPTDALDALVRDENDTAPAEPSGGAVFASRLPRRRVTSAAGQPAEVA